MAAPRLYPLAYRFIPQANRTAAELRAEELGGCDAVILHSILFPADGSRSEQIVSMDGRTGDTLTPDELFKSWAMMAHALIDLLPEGGRRQFCSMVHETIRAAVLDRPIVDHHALLVKYIQHVSMSGPTDGGDHIEGTSFEALRSWEAMGLRPALFTDTEWAELQRLAEEARRG